MVLYNATLGLNILDQNHQMLRFLAEFIVMLA